MAGSPDEKPYENVGDVVIENVDDVIIENAEDVFVEDDAAPYGEIALNGAEDVTLTGANSDHGSVQRDVIIDDGGETTIRRAEDVTIMPRAVSGDVTIRDVEDVLIEDVTGACIERVEDVFVETRAVDGDRATVTDAQDIYLREAAVSGDVSIEGAEEVSLTADAVRGSVTNVDETDGSSSYHTARSHLRITGVEDVIIETDAVDGDLIVANADAVTNDSE